MEVLLLKLRNKVTLYLLSQLPWKRLKNNDTLTRSRCRSSYKTQSRAADESCCVIIVINNSWACVSFGFVVVRVRGRQL